MQSERFDFPGADGQILAARLDRPLGATRAYALFAHCFTCGKDIFAATRISRALTKRGIAVLRFDFTGLGNSEGEFANAGFSSNIQDLLAAVEHLRTTAEAPELLIGHSLGGAAVLAAAPLVPEARAVATLGAPADPAHVRHNFDPDGLAAIERDGIGEVKIGGRPFNVSKRFLDDLEAHDLAKNIAELKKALLVCHAPMDRIVGIENAQSIFIAAKHPKSFLSLDDADHLLSREEDATYAALTIAAWAQRYLSAPSEERIPVTPIADKVVVRDTGLGGFQQAMALDRHIMLADEPKSVGGMDTGPDPYELLLGALGACTSMTMRMYAKRKGWAFDDLSVTLAHEKVHATDCADCETVDGKVDQITREIRVVAPDLTEEQTAKLFEMADKCPVHRTLHSEVKIRTRRVQ